MNDQVTSINSTISVPTAAAEVPLSLPSHYYSDAEIYDLEMRKIFHCSWIFAGYRSQLRNAGDYITAQVGDEHVIVVRDHDNTLRGFYNVCRHRAHRLLEDTGHVKDITCPYHAWRYGLDGSLKYARNSDRVTGFDATQFCLRGVQVEDFCGIIFVNLDNHAAPLIEQVPQFAEELRDYEPRLDRLQLVYRRQITIESNWKNVVDNYNENYHTPVVHKLLASILDDSYRVILKGKYLRHESNASPGADGGFQVTTADYPKHVTWWLWPNLCPMSIPGGGFRILHVKPDGPNRTQETYDFYLPYAEPTDAQWRQIHFAVDVINAEDIGVAESIQRGLRSRSFDRSYIMIDPELGPYSEHAVAHFKDMVLDALHGESA